MGSNKTEFRCLEAVQHSIAAPPSSQYEPFLRIIPTTSTYFYTEVVERVMSEESGRDWAEELSAAERVEAVALTVSEPRTANWIATEAEVAHETATKYLKRLVDDSKLRAETHGQQTAYAPDPVGQYLIEMRELYENHSPDDLATSLEEMNGQIRTWKAEYDVETPNGLRASLSRAADREDERTRRQAAREWEHLQTRRRLVEDALRLYDRFPSEQNPVSA